MTAAVVQMMTLNADKGYIELMKSLFFAVENITAFWFGLSKYGNFRVAYWNFIITPINTGIFVNIFEHLSRTSGLPSDSLMLVCTSNGSCRPTIELISPLSITCFLDILRRSVVSGFCAMNIRTRIYLKEPRVFSGGPLIGLCVPAVKIHDACWSKGRCFHKC